MKSVKNLLIPFIILIALIICVIVYLVFDKINNKPSIETTVGGIDVVYYNLADISSVSVYNRQSGITTLVKCYSDADNTMQFEYLGDDYDSNEVYSQVRLNDYVSNLIAYYGYYKISNPGSFAEFGLDNPSYTINIKIANGTETIVYIGNKTPDEKYCYMNIEGSSDIYSVSANKLIQLDKSSINFLDTSVINIDLKDLKTIHFDRKSDGLSIEASITVSDSGITEYKIIEPYTHSVSAYFIKLVNSVTNLEISDYLDIDSSEMAYYGLDDPAFHFILTKNNGDTYEEYFSNKSKGYYYGYVKGSDKYFSISEHQLDCIELQENVLIDSYICYFQVKDISSITGTYGDQSFKFEINVPDGKTLMGDSSSVKLNGRNAKITDSYGRSYCSILFESITCINIGGIETEASVNKSSGPVLTLSFVGKNYATTVYEFYTRNADSYYVFKNGEYMNFYVYSREIFNNGGTDTYNYGYWSAYELLSEAITGNSNGIYDMPVNN